MLFDIAQIGQCLSGISSGCRVGRSCAVALPFLLAGIRRAGPLTPNIVKIACARHSTVFTCYAYWLAAVAAGFAILTQESTVSSFLGHISTNDQIHGIARAELSIQAVIPPFSIAYPTWTTGLANSLSLRLRRSSILVLQTLRASSSVRGVRH
jgi:hypothetical protein